ncbi:MAG: hypothetical protein WC380_00090 [Pedobacter sp.]|jgi:hypothetical protein
MKTLKKRFIAWSPAKEHFNFKGESLGMGGERAIYRAKNNTDISSDRRYRDSYPQNPSKNLTLMTYMSYESAKEDCDWINSAHKDTFQVKRIL